MIKVLRSRSYSVQARSYSPGRIQLFLHLVILTEEVRPGRQRCHTSMARPTAVSLIGRMLIMGNLLSYFRAKNFGDAINHYASSNTNKE